MKRRFLILLALSACSSSSPVKPPSPYGNWDYTGTDGTAHKELTIENDGTYVVSLLSLTSAMSANAQVETGVVTIQTSSVTFTPRSWSCTGVSDPPYAATYAFADGNLVLTDAKGATVYQPAASPADRTFTRTTGCFPPGGTFVPSPLSPLAMGTLPAPSFTWKTCVRSTGMGSWASERRTASSERPVRG